MVNLSQAYKIINVDGRSRYSWFRGMRSTVHKRVYRARSARHGPEQDSVFFEPQGCIFRQIALSAKPVFHGMLQLSERHMGADFDQAIG